MYDICPLMSSRDTNGNVMLMRCRDDCKLNLGADCALKIIGIAALKDIRSANEDSNNSSIADKQEKE